MWEITFHSCVVWCFLIAFYTVSILLTHPLWSSHTVELHGIRLYPFFTCISCCHGVKYNVKSNWVAKLFSQAVTIGGEGWAATMLVNKTLLKWTHHNYWLYYPSRSRTEAPASNWLTNHPICARPIEIIVLVCSSDMLTESYQGLWLKQSISRWSHPTCLNLQLFVEKIAFDYYTLDS